MPSGDNNRKLSDAQRDEAVARYTTPMDDGTWCGTSTIARELDVSPGTIINLLRKRGIPVRDAKAAHAHGKRCRPITNLPVGDAPPCACSCGTPTLWNRRKKRWNRYVEGHYRRDAAYKNPAWLRREYITHHRPAKDIATECGVTLSSVLKQMRKLGIPARDASAAHIGTQAGAANPAWKGGVTPERQRLYKTPEWRSLVVAVFTRDGHRCVRCAGVKKENRRLHAHHLQPWADAPHARMDATNLVTLCSICHRWVHSRQNVGREFLE